MPHRNHGQTSINVDYYDGAYGPTLRVEVSARFLIEMLLEPFVLLSERRSDAIDFVRATNARCSGFVGLTLALAKDRTRGGLRRVMTAGGLPHFTWVNDAEGWGQCVDLIRPFRHSVEPGHAT